MNLFYKIGIIFIGICLALILANGPGTCDVPHYVIWGRGVADKGMIKGYIESNRIFPPLSSAINGLAVKYIRYGNDLLRIKLSLTIMLILSATLLLIWTKTLNVAALFIWALLLESSSHGYLDIYYIFFLIIALWSISKKNLVLFASSYTIACWIKQLPLIIGPFFLIYGLTNMAGLKLGKFLLRAALAALPVVIICLIIISLYGVETLKTPVGRLFDPMLSGYGLNYNWLYTYYMRVFKPAMFGKLADGSNPAYVQGECNIIRTRDPAVIRAPQTIFAIFYGLSLILCILRKKTLENLVLFSLLGYLSYCMFAPGVHENHYVIATFLSIILLWLNRAYTYPAIAVIAMANVNMLVFYGLLGNEFCKECSRVMFGFDLSVALAALYLLLFLGIYIRAILPISMRKKDQGNLIDETGRGASAPANPTCLGTMEETTFSP